MNKLNRCNLRIQGWIVSFFLLLSANVWGQSWSQSGTNAAVCSGTATIKFTSSTLNSSLCPQYSGIVHTWYTAATGGGVVASQVESSSCSGSSGLVVTRVTVTTGVTYYVMPFYNGSAMLGSRVAVTAIFSSAPGLSANYPIGQQVCSGSLILTASGGSVSGWYKDGVQISGASGTAYSPAASGSYKALVATASCGSLYTGEYLATILQPTIPTVTITSSPGGTTFCQGTNVTFTASANVTGASYSWSTGETTASIVKTINAAATYSVTMTTTQSCVTSATANTTISVGIYAIPTVQGIVPDLNYCSTTSGVSISVSGASASWVYRLYQGGNSLAVAPAPGQNGLVTFPGTYTAGTYSVTTENPTCSSVRTTIDNSVIIIKTQVQNLYPAINVVSPAEVTTTNGIVYRFCHDNAIRLDMVGSGSCAVQWGGVSGTVDGSNPNTFYPSIDQGATAILTATVTPGFCMNVTQPLYTTITRQTPTPLSSGVLTKLSNCGRTDIVLTEPPGVSEFWQQTNNIAMKETNYIPGGQANKTMLSFTTTQTLYLRARQGQCWSDAILPVVVSIQSNPTVTIAPIKTTVCKGEPGSVQANVSAGATFSWFDMQHKFLSADAVYTTGPLYKNLTVQLEAKTAIGCTTTRDVTFTAVSETQQPQEPTITKLTNTSYSMTLTNPQTGYTYYWQTNPDGTSTTDLANPKTVSTPGIYFLKPRNNSTGCWGVVYGAEVVDVQPHLKTVGNSNLVQHITYQTDQSPVLSNPNHVSIENNYFDGIGRGNQKISWQASPNKKDLVVPMEYDELGRIARSYLPYQSTADNGLIKTTPYQDQYNFYNAANNKIARSSYPFSFQQMERSSLQRPTKQSAAGESWSGVAGTSNSMEVKVKYEISDGEQVLKWTFTSPSSGYCFGKVDAGTAALPSRYPAGSLLRNRTKDEQGNEVITYTDLKGRIVLKRVQAVSGTPTINDTNYASTYYIYDDMDNLVCVIPPEAVSRLSTEFLSASDASKQSFLINWAFRYGYDSRRRMKLKQVPGADSVRMVYDFRDRLVMTQDGNQRTLSLKQWSFTKYDVLDRPVVTGLYQSNSDRTAIQSAVDNYYKNLTASTAWFETYLGASVGNVLGYDNKSFPQVSSESNYRTAIYYDSYDSLIAPAGFTYAVETPALAGQEPSGSPKVLGLVTGTRVRNLTWGSWMRTVNYYDAKYRVIQTISERLKGIVRTTNILDFPGRILVSKRTYMTSSVTTTIKETFTYDHSSRLLNVKHSLNGAADVMIAKNTYNEIGQLVDKQLHSTDFTNFKQSVDYRYNIRGWLTSMNNATLTADANNDDTNDYFGMNLLYNNVDNDLGNSQLYNGNISGMKWSNYTGTTTTNPKGYTYTYDPMNRITGSTFKEKTTSWTTPANNGFAETGYTYDLNGNIKTLRRNDKRTSGWMDDMTYNYGSGTTQSNKLLKVEDAGDDFAGFIDGNAGATYDYTYDANGNLTRDLNKGIGTSLVDATNIITYNFMNLPETITKGGNNVRYLYDANGAKLAQIVKMGTITKQTDYLGELTYENDALQSINHIEGRIMMASTKLIYADHGENTSTMPANLGAVISLVTQNGSEKYVKITSSATTGNGTFRIGGTFNVFAGERYRIRVKGYRNSTGTKDAYVLIKVNGMNVNWPGAKLPASDVTESWIEQTVTIPWLTSGVIPMEVGVVWDAATSGEVMFINEFEITKLQTTTPEYQYNLKDHLGNVRLTFTTKQETDGATATLERANAPNETSKFMRYDNARLVTYYLFDHTNGSAPSTTPGTAQRLRGKQESSYSGNNETYGLARSLSVMPGDVINMEVYGKYIDSNPANLTAVLNAFILQIAAGTAGGWTVSDGVNYRASTSSFPFTGSQNGTNSSSGTGPKAYLNWLVFDRNYILIPGKSGYSRLTTVAKETGQDVAHEKLSGSVTISEPGYVYIYLSNEEGTNAYEVYFDDFKVDQIKSPVIQTDDYYPFGLAYNSYSRENSVPNKIKFQGQEHVDDLGLNWDSFKWRNHQPDIGRFFNIDPLSEKYYYNSPYAFSENHVVSHRELEGLEKVEIIIPEEPADRVIREYKNMDDKIVISPVADPVISSEFGPRVVPMPGASNPHPGIDIVKTNQSETDGSEVVAPVNGKITQITSIDGNGAGNRISITANKDGVVHKFFHLQTAGFADGLKVNTNIARGTKIGNIGSTGNSTAPHLHYETRQNGTPLNPRTENTELTNAPTTAEARTTPPPTNYVTPLPAQQTQQTIPLGGFPSILNF
jgi:RHS repeat-associated protein